MIPVQAQVELRQSNQNQTHFKLSGCEVKIQVSRSFSTSRPIASTTTPKSTLESPESQENVGNVHIEQHGGQRGSDALRGAHPEKSSLAGIEPRVLAVEGTNSYHSTTTAHEDNSDGTSSHIESEFDAERDPESDLYADSESEFDDVDVGVEVGVSDAGADGAGPDGDAVVAVSDALNQGPARTDDVSGKGQVDRPEEPTSAESQVDNSGITKVSPSGDPTQIFVNCFSGTGVFSGN